MPARTARRLTRSEVAERLALHLFQLDLAIELGAIEAPPSSGYWAAPVVELAFTRRRAIHRLVGSIQDLDGPNTAVRLNDAHPGLDLTIDTVNALREAGYLRATAAGRSRIVYRADSVDSLLNRTDVADVLAKAAATAEVMSTPEAAAALGVREERFRAIASRIGLPPSARQSTPRCPTNRMRVLYVRTDIHALQSHPLIEDERRRRPLNTDRRWNDPRPNQLDAHVRAAQDRLL